MKTKTEEFRKIKGSEDYEVSDLGNVRKSAHISYNLGGFLVYHKSKVVIPHLCNGYLVVWFNKKRILIHQLVAITFLNHKPCGNKLVVDHINAITKDNRLENLQVITHRENCSKDKKGKSKYTGVGVDIDGFKTQIRISGKVVHLGCFKNEEDAANIYKMALQHMNLYTGDKKAFRNLIKTFI